MNGIPYATTGTDYYSHALAAFYKKPQVFATPEFQKFVMVNWLFKDMAEKIGSGNKLEWRFIRDLSGESQTTSPFQILPTEHEDFFSNGTSHWCETTERCVWNEKIMGDMKGEAELANYFDSKVLVAITRVMNFLEACPFRVKQNASDLKTPDGIPWWFPKLDVGVEDTTGGFNGDLSTYGDGTTTATIGGTDRSAVPQARTAVGTYNGMNAGAIDTIRHLQNITDYQIPSDIAQYIAWTKAQWKLIMGFTPYEQYNALVNAGPDPRNGDANPFNGELTVCGMKVEKVAAMNNLSDSPIYGINSSMFFPWRHNKFWWNWTPTDNVQGDFYTKFKDVCCKFNFVAVNEKPAGFCLHRVRTA